MIRKPKHQKVKPPKATLPKFQSSANAQPAQSAVVTPSLALSAPSLSPSTIPIAHVAPSNESKTPMPMGAPHAAPFKGTVAQKPLVDVANLKFVRDKVALHKNAWSTAYGPIRTVDFTNEPHAYVKDQYTALTCMTVMTMKGSHGSITHLNFGDADPGAFVTALRGVLKDDAEGAQVILSGGNWSTPPSTAAEKSSHAFYVALRAALLDAGFTISAEHVGGRGGRNAILYPDRVEVAGETLRF